MRKFLLLPLLFFSFAPTYAINWQELTTPLNRTVYLDLDSIKLEDGYYFYNIKYNFNSKEIISTIQSGEKRSFSKVIKNYSPDEYKNLNGDYNNITANKTKNLEPVNFESTINTCYKKVKSLTKKETDYINY